LIKESLGTQDSFLKRKEIRTRLSINKRGDKSEGDLAAGESKRKK